MGGEFLLTWALGLLVVGGGACILLGKLKRPWPDARGPLAVITSLGALVVGYPALLWQSAVPVSYGTFDLPAPLGLDMVMRPFGLAGMLGWLALLFGYLVMLYSLGYWKRSAASPAGAPPGFYAFSLWAVAGACVALTTGHLLVFVLAWEVVTLMLYLLIGMGGPRARAGAAKTFAILGFSDAMIILGVAGLMAWKGPAALYMASLEGPLHVDISQLSGIQMWQAVGIYLALLIGALAKAGAFPLHTWIPAAADGAPAPVMALLPASIDKLLGIMLLARISLGFFTLSAGLGTLLMVIGAVTIVGAVMMAMMQHELRRLLSFHAVSQVGYMVLGIGTGVPIGIVGGLFHMVNHSIYKSLLFLSGGAVQRELAGLDGPTRTERFPLELDRLGGLGRAMPFTFVCFLIGALAISGIPPLNGFFSKWFVYQGVIGAGSRMMPLLLAAAVLGSALTLASFVKAVHSIFLGQRSPEPGGPPEQVREAPKTMLLTLGTLAGLCILLGIGASAFTTVRLSSLSLEWAGLHVEAAEPMAGLATPVWTAALIAVGLVLGLILYVAGRALKVKRVRGFLAGETALPVARATPGRGRLSPPAVRAGAPVPVDKPLASTHMSGTGFYLTVRNLPIIRGFYTDAEREAFDPYRVVGQYGLRVVEWLRGLHSGILETYVTWVLAGAMLVLALVFLLG